MYKVDRRLYLTSDRSRVVEEGDPDAAILLAGGPGDEIPEAEALRLGLMAQKAQPKPEDKALKPPRNKAAPRSAEK